MCPDHDRLETLLDRLRELELRIPPSHERPIVEVARAALTAEIRGLAGRLARRDYLRARPARGLASA